MAKIIKSSQAAPGVFVTYQCGALVAIAVAGALAESEAPVGDFDDDNTCADVAAETEQRLQELYSEGLRRGIEAGRAEFREAVAESNQVLRQAAEAIREARERFLAATEPSVLHLVREITSRILLREATVDPELVVSTIRAALRTLTEREGLIVRVNPRDLQALREQGINPFEGVEGAGEIELVADETVGLGGCLVESASLQVDARLEQQLERIFEKLVG